jgi:hypothetical protein
MFQRSAAAGEVLFLVRPLTDDYLVEQPVCGTCVFPLVWRVSDHSTTRLCCQSRAVGPFNKRSGPVEGYVRRCS